MRTLVIRGLRLQVLESHGTQADGVEQVFCIHNQGTVEQVLDAVEIETAKFRPTGADHQRIHALRPRRKAIRNRRPCHSVRVRASGSATGSYARELVRLEHQALAPGAPTKNQRRNSYWA